MTPDRPVTVSEAARLVGPAVGREVRPQEVTRLLYERRIPTEQAPLVAGRRQIPHALLPEIVAALTTRKGKRQRSQEVAAQ